MESGTGADADCKRHLSLLMTLYKSFIYDDVLYSSESEPAESRPGDMCQYCHPESLKPQSLTN